MQGELSGPGILALLGHDALHLPGPQLPGSCINIFDFRFQVGELHLFRRGRALGLHGGCLMGHDLRRDV
jgi:hypothetical protein